jgi:hypothetical protein
MLSTHSVANPYWRIVTTAPQIVGERVAWWRACMRYAHDLFRTGRRKSVRLEGVDSISADVNAAVVGGSQPDDNSRDQQDLEAGLEVIDEGKGDEDEGDEPVTTSSLRLPMPAEADCDAAAEAPEAVELDDSLPRSNYIPRVRSVSSDGHSEQQRSTNTLSLVSKRSFPSRKLAPPIKRLGKYLLNKKDRMNTVDLGVAIAEIHGDKNGGDLSQWDVPLKVRNFIIISFLCILCVGVLKYHNAHRSW